VCGYGFEISHILITKSMDNPELYIHLMSLCCRTIYCTDSAVVVNILFALIVSTEKINGKSSVCQPLRHTGENGGVASCILNLLKPSGNFTYHQV
jgi:hypothetical protein